MPETQNLGTLQHISADAVGQPGQRRFRLRLITQSPQYAYVWLEKEQLVGLKDAIVTILDEYDHSPIPTQQEESVFPLDVDVELDIRAGNLSLGLKEAEDLIVLIAAGVSLEEAISLSVEFDYARRRALCVQIETVVASGRQPCPLCGGPIDPEGHVCPRSNGFHKNPEE